MQCDHPNLDPLLTVRELYNPLYSTFSSSQYVRQSHPLRPIQPNRLLFFLSTKTIVGLSTDSQLQSPLAWTRCIYSISKLLYPSHFFSFLYIPSSSYEVPLRSHLSSGTLLKSLTYLRNPMLSLPSLLFSSLVPPPCFRRIFQSTLLSFLYTSLQLRTLPPSKLASAKDPNMNMPLLSFLHTTSRLLCCKNFQDMLLKLNQLWSCRIKYQSWL